MEEKKLHPIVALARETVERYVGSREIVRPAASTPEMREKAGVFVSIHKHGQLRGCIGTFMPTRSNVAEEIVQNAISSATRDYRFSPITAAELPDLTYKVDILTPPQPVQSRAELDHKKYGVVVEHGAKKGLLLPDLEGVESVDHQIEIASAKAGIGPNEPIRIYRFEVRRFEEEGD